MSDLEQTLISQVRLAGLPDPVLQLKPIPGRKYAWDLAWPSQRLLLEVQGGTWSGGAHARGAGIARDCEKLNLATIHGWRCIAVTTDQIREGRALAWLQRVLQREFGEEADALNETFRGRLQDRRKAKVF